MTDGAQRATPESFLHGVFAGELRTSPLLPFPLPDAETLESLEMILDSQGRFLSDQVDPAAIDAAGGIPERLIRAYGELGLYGLTIPEEHGGFGADYWTYCRVLEQLSGYDASFGTVLGGHQGIGYKAVLLAGTDEQKRDWLPQLATGEWMACFALTEAEAGSDVNNMSMRALPTDDGEVYELDGEKIWITNGGIAQFVTIFAKVPVPGDNGQTREAITAFALTPDMIAAGPGESGWYAGPPEKKMGLRGSSTTSIVVNKLRVPKTHRLGAIGQGFKIAMGVLNYGRLSLASAAVGSMKQMLSAAREFAETRVTMGRPIIEHGQIAEHIANIEVDTYASDAMTYLTAGNADRGQEMFQLESAACKVYSTEALWRVVNTALQVAGGTGFMSEYPYERYLRDARINLIFEGTNEILRMFIALWGLKHLGTPKPPETAPEFTGLTEALVPFGARVARAVEVTGAAVAAAVKEHGRALGTRQLIQRRIADLMLSVYAAAATLARVEHDLGTSSPAPAARARLLGIADLITRRCETEVAALAAELTDNSDDALLDIALGPGRGEEGQPRGA